MDTPAQPVSHEEEALYKKLFETSNDAIMLLNDKGFFDCNEATLRMFGYHTKEEFCGKSPSDHSPPTQPDGRNSMEKADEYVRLAHEKGKNFFEWVHRRKSGEDFPADVLLTPVFYSGKTVILATVRDISERKRVEEERNRLAAIVESSDDAILGKDLQGVILSWNKGAERLYGYTESEIKGKNIALLIPEDRKNEMNDIMKKISRGEKIKRMRTIRVKKDGNTVEVSITTSPIKDLRGQIIGASTIARDITESRKTERDLLEKVTELERLNRLMVGRELKMTEMKQELEQLRKTVR